MSARAAAKDISGVIYDDKGNAYAVDFKNISANGIKFKTHNLPPTGVVYIWTDDYDLVTDVYVSKLYEDKEGTAYVITTVDVKELEEYQKIYNIAVAKEYLSRLKEKNTNG